MYSVPGFGNEWYPRNTYMEGSAEFGYHIKTYGAHNKFGYKDFIPMFKAEKWDPEQWASRSIVDPMMLYEMLVFEQD